MTLKKRYIQVADKKDYFLSCNFKWESQARQSLRLRTFLFGSVTGCEKSTTVFPSFILISMRRIRSWRRRAWGHCSGRTNTPEIVVSKGFLWSNTLLNTGWTMDSSGKYHHTYRKGWMIYLTAPSHISQRGSRYTTWTKTVRVSRTGRYRVLVHRFTMLHSVGSMTWQNVWL